MREYASLEKILAIMPAEPGWRVVFDVGGEACIDPLVCWALVRLQHYDGEKHVPIYTSETVAGVIASGTGTEVVEHWQPRRGDSLFSAYLRPGQKLESLPPPSQDVEPASS